MQFPSEGGYPEGSNATVALALALASFVVSILAPVALWISIKEIRAIESGRRSPEGLKSARAARVISIVTTILAVLGIFVLVLIVAVGRQF